MAVEFYDVEQGSEEWHGLRCGIPTASMFATVMAKGRGKEPSKTRRAYMLKLIGERMTGEPADSYTNHHMERGKEMEAEARDFYAFQTDAEPELIGFAHDPDKGAGASPDSLVDGGMLEIKTKLPHLHLEALLADRLPPDHRAQVHGQLWVCEREWCDFMSYWPGMPPFIHREYRDEDYIKTIASEVQRFNEELADLEEKIRQRSTA